MSTTLSTSTMSTDAIFLFLLCCSPPIVVLLSWSVLDGFFVAGTISFCILATCFGGPWNFIVHRNFQTSLREIRGRSPAARNCAGDSPSLFQEQRTSSRHFPGPRESKPEPLLANNRASAHYCHRVRVFCNGYLPIAAEVLADGGCPNRYVSMIAANAAI